MTNWSGESLPWKLGNVWAGRDMATLESRLSQLERCGADGPTFRNLDPLTAEWLEYLRDPAKAKPRPMPEPSVGMADLGPETRALLCELRAPPM